MSDARKREAVRRTVVVVHPRFLHGRFDLHSASSETVKISLRFWIGMQPALELPSTQCQAVKQRYAKPLRLWMPDVGLQNIEDGNLQQGARTTDLSS